MKKYLIFVIVLTLIFSVGFVVFAAKPNFQNKKVSIPDKALKVAPDVFYLGSVWREGKLVEGYAFIDYKKGFGKPGTECGNGICEPGENINKCPQDCGGEEPEPDNSSCYGFLNKFTKWKTAEPWVLNPSNSRGLAEDFIFSNFSTNIEKWESAANFNIVGQGIVTSDELIADLSSPDGQNEVYFADIDSAGAIGVTIIWGIFNVPPKERALIEWDQIYDDVDFDWSATGEAGKMDFENIATHELGHTVGLDDLYTAECSEQTMYGYADYGETKKRSLEAGDIKGIQELYK